MPSWFTKLKPGVSARTHLILASMLWTGIGALLLYRGIMYLRDDRVLLAALAGIILGTLKSRFVLDRTAIRGVARIKTFGDNTCIGAVYSWKTWLLVLSMMLMGFVLRLSPVSPLLLGLACTAIGWSLLYSSRHGWRELFIART
jgi:hypothetical protein